MPLLVVAWLAMNQASFAPVALKGRLDVAIRDGVVRVSQGARGLAMPLFTVEAEGRRFGPGDLRPSGKATVEEGERFRSDRPGRAQPDRTIRACFQGEGFRLDVRLRTYRDLDIVRPEYRLTATRAMRVASIAIAIEAPGARVAGVDDGSPLVSEAWFAAIEHPMAKAEAEAGRATSVLPLDADLAPGESVVVDGVVGTYQRGQLRRAFQTYLEAFRAQPRRSYLHPNCWFDLGFPSRPPFTEAEVLGRMAAFHEELTVRRGVTLDGYVLDDPWDDPNSLWGFPKDRFPNGWTKLAELARTFRWDLGVWMSPFGGYGENRARRVRFGKSQSPPFETHVVNGHEGFSLAGASYYRRFREVALSLMDTAGVRAFKFDGIGGGLYQRGPNPSAVQDYLALFRLTRDLRARDPRVFINATVGTWHSPFWLFYVDSIWRDGEDTLNAGTGSNRERWITYRDGNWYRSAVREAPLYPIGCAMLVGPTLAEHAPHGLNAPLASGDDLRSFLAEVFSFFGMGVTLQELYLTPGLLTPEAWDGLARAVRWARAHDGTLGDAHWVGGDPLKGEAYGAAAWNAGRATLMLRNPGARPIRFEFNPAAAFELPPRAIRRFRLRPDLTTHAAGPVVTDGQPVTIPLAPFEVSVWSGQAAKS